LFEEIDLGQVPDRKDNESGDAADERREKYQEQG
jgi:hypothetical protein